MNEVILNKVATIERCIERIKEEYHGHEKALFHDYTRQDSIILNLQRACEASIDLAAHIIRIRCLGSPQVTSDIFRILFENKIISEKLCKRLQTMVGFRNIAVHNYTELNMEVVKSILEHHLTDLTRFTKMILKIEDQKK